MLFLIEVKREKSYTRKLMYTRINFLEEDVQLTSAHYMLIVIKGMKIKVSSTSNVKAS